MGPSISYFLSLVPFFAYLSLIVFVSFVYSLIAYNQSVFYLDEKIHFRRFRAPQNSFIRTLFHQYDVISIKTRRIKYRNYFTFLPVIFNSINVIIVLCVTITDLINGGKISEALFHYSKYRIIYIGLGYVVPSAIYYIFYFQRGEFERNAGYNFSNKNGKLDRKKSLSYLNSYEIYVDIDVINNIELTCENMVKVFENKFKELFDNCLMSSCLCDCVELLSVCFYLEIDFFDPKTRNYSETIKQKIASVERENAEIYDCDDFSDFLNLFIEKCAKYKIEEK